MAVRFYIEVDSAKDFQTVLQSFTDSLPSPVDYEAITNQIKELKEDLLTNIETLQAEVAENTSVTQSAVTLLTQLSQMIKDAGTDPVKLAEITNALDANNNALAAAVAANTPAAS